MSANPGPVAPKSQAPSAAARAMVDRLIAFNTVSRDSNLGLIEWARDYLHQHGARARLTHDASGKKANLFATLGDSKKPGLILSGHTDVVPVEGQNWDTDPFVAGRTRRQALCAGLGGHEGVHRRRARAGAEIRRGLERQSARCAAALCAELRRGGGLPRACAA